MKDGGSGGNGTFPPAFFLTKTTLAAAPEQANLLDLDAEKTDAGNAPGHEADANRKRRMAWEAVMIAQADASIAAGRVVDEPAVDAWIDSIGTDHELPLLYSGR